jgi:hypothetical protein
MSSRPAGSSRAGRDRQKRGSERRNATVKRALVKGDECAASRRPKFAPLDPCEEGKMGVSRPNHDTMPGSEALAGARSGSQSCSARANHVLRSPISNLQSVTLGDCRSLVKRYLTDTT